MTSFRTEYKAQAAPFSLSVTKPMLLMGSCFSDNIGGLMRHAMWDVAVNPCGTLFNPRSVADALHIALGLKCLRPPFDSGAGFRSWELPSAFGAPTAEAAAARAGAAFDRLAVEVARAQALTVTFGTSWIYSLAGDPSAVVANCHRQPSALFQRRRMEVDEIAGLWIETAAMLRRCNPGLRLIFTVSPVRHLKDGFNGNALSKATLLLACERICSSLEDANYFPAYEIVGDDLRDYRFYTQDMVHPSPQTSEYVWMKFQETYLSAGDRALLAEGDSLRRRLLHRPMTDADPAGAARFENDTRRLLDAFLAAHPAMKP